MKIFQGQITYITPKLICCGQVIYNKVGVDISSPSYIHQGWCRYFKAKLYTLRFGCLCFNSKLCIPMLMSIFRGQAIYIKVGVDISSPSYVHQGWCQYFKAKLYTLRFRCLYFNSKLTVYTNVDVDISRPTYIHQCWCRYFEAKLYTPRLVSIFRAQVMYTKVGVDISRPSYYTLRFTCLYFNSKLCMYTNVDVDISRPSYIHQGWCRYFEPKLYTPRLVLIFQ